MIDFELSNGVKIPALGYGVFQMTSAEVHEHLPQAIELGFRHIDTANGYYNEVAVGEEIAKSGIPRDQFFVTTKLWPRDYPYEACKKAIDSSLRRLGMDYVDLMPFPKAPTMMCLMRHLPSSIRCLTLTNKCKEGSSCQKRILKLALKNQKAVFLV